MHVENCSHQYSASFSRNFSAACFGRSSFNELCLSRFKEIPIKWLRTAPPPPGIATDTFSSSFRCDARATVQWNPVRLQRGCLPRQSPALLHLQLRVDRSAAGHRLRQLPVSCPFSILRDVQGPPPPTGAAHLAHVSPN